MMILAMLLVLIAVGLFCLCLLISRNTAKKTDWKGIRKDLEMPISFYSDRKWVYNFYFFLLSAFIFELLSVKFAMDFFFATTMEKGLSYFFLTAFMVMATLVEWIAFTQIYKTRRYYHYNYDLEKWVEKR